MEYNCLNENKNENKKRDKLKTALITMGFASTGIAYLVLGWIIYH
jgi:hypothetical protein